MATSKYKPRSQLMKSKHRNAEISIVIPVKNGEKTLGECLGGVFRQKCSLPFEVIAIDSGSTDGSLAVLGKYKTKIVEIKPEEFGHGRTRNKGALIAEGRYLVYLTQDATPANDRWLQILVDSIQDNSVAGAYSRNIPRPGCNPLEERKVLEMFSSKKMTKKHEDALTKKGTQTNFYFSNVSSIIKREVWEKIPFDDRARFAEDHQWAAEALKAGYTLVYEPSSEVFHSHDYSIRERIQRSYASPTGKRNLIKLLLIIPVEILKDWQYCASKNSSFWEKLWYMAYAVPYRYLSAIAYWLGSIEVIF